MADPNSNSPDDLLSPITDGDEPSVVVVEHGAQFLDVNDSSTFSTSSDKALDATGDRDGGSDHSEALGRGITTLITGVIRDLDSNAVVTSRSQDQVSCALDRLTRELDQLLEDAPVPFIMQHAAKVSGVRKRVSSLNTVLRSIQRRLDNIDRMLTVGLPHGHGSVSRMYIHEFPDLNIYQISNSPSSRGQGVNLFRVQ